MVRKALLKGENGVPESEEAELGMRNLAVPRVDVSRRERVKGLQPDLRTAQSPLECEKRAKRKIRPFERLRKL